MSAHATTPETRFRVTDVEITVALRRLVVGLVLLTSGIALGVMIAVEVDPFDVDTWWNGAVGSFAPGLTQAALVLDFLGGGWFATYVVPIGGFVVLLAVRRLWSGVYFVSAVAVSAAVVQVLKATFGRVRPEEMLVISDAGSYPSGHAANAATIAVVAVFLFRRTWVVAVAALWVFLMSFSRTQVHAHWLSDTLGGVLVGVGVALIMTAVFTLPLMKERSLG